MTQRTSASNVLRLAREAHEATKTDSLRLLGAQLHAAPEHRSPANRLQGAAVSGWHPKAHGSGGVGDEAHGRALGV